MRTTRLRIRRSGRCSSSSAISVKHPKRPPPRLKGASKASKIERDRKLAEEGDLEEDQEAEEDFDDEHEDSEEGGMEEDEEEDDPSVPACVKGPKSKPPKVPMKKPASRVVIEPALPTPCRRLQRKSAMEENDVLFVRSSKSAERDELDTILSKIHQLELIRPLGRINFHGFIVPLK